MHRVNHEGDMVGFFIFLFSFSSMTFADGLEVLLLKSPSCETRAYQDQLDALDSIARLKMDLTKKLEIEAVKNSKFHQNQIKKAIKILDCSLDVMDEVEFICEPDKACVDKGYIAHTGWKGKGPVYLCEGFWRKDLVQSATIVHELTHKCGSLDLEYNEKENGVKTYPRYKYASWGYSQNADNYDYWAREGVCIPEVDCPENETSWKMLKDIGL